MDKQKEMDGCNVPQGEKKTQMYTQENNNQIFIPEKAGLKSNNSNKVQTARGGVTSYQLILAGLVSEVHSLNIHAI